MSAKGETMDETVVARLLELENTIAWQGHEIARLRAIETAARRACAVLDEEADVIEPQQWIERLADRLHVAFAASGEGV